MQHQSRFFILTTMSKSGNLASLEEFSCVCLLRHHLLPIISPQAWEWRKHSRYSCWNKCLDDISIVVALAFIIKSLVVTFLFNDPMMHKVASWWFSFKDFFVRISFTLRRRRKSHAHCATVAHMTSHVFVCLFPLARQSAHSFSIECLVSRPSKRREESLCVFICCCWLCFMWHLDFLIKKCSW